MGQLPAHQIDDNLITISIDHPAEEGSAALSAVKQREIELKTELLITRQAADEILAKARSEAAAIRSGAAFSGQNNAQKTVEKAVLKAKEEAAKITQGTAQAVNSLTSQGEKGFDRAVAFIMATVAPRDKGVKNVITHE